MSQFTRTHGDYKQVAVYDAGVTATGAGSSTGVNAVTSGVTVQPQGPKLEMYTVTFTGASPATGTQINTAVQTIQQLSIVYLYEYTTATNSTLSIAAYPVGAWDFTVLEAELTTAVGVTCTIGQSATFTS